jgi:hypothetical protein
MTLAALPLLAACHSNKTAEKDVAITACRDDPGGGRPTADGTVVNNSSKASTYIVSVSFIDSSGNNVTNGGATLGKVLSGATAIFHAEGVTGAKGPLTCKVSSVQRTVAP